VVDAVAELERGRELCASQAWRDAYESLSAADRAERLGAEDLELLATAAYMLGREDAYLTLLERAHGAHLDANEPMRAVRSALWIGTHFAQHGEMARASGWLGRAQRLLERNGPDEVERGYLLLPSVFRHEARGDLEAARVAGEAVEIAERFGDRDLFALAAQVRGHILIEHGHLTDGLALLDEAMVPAAAGELSPIVTGIVYCGVILAVNTLVRCRARGGPACCPPGAIANPIWLPYRPPPDYRAEIMQLAGSWSMRSRHSGTRAVPARTERGSRRQALPPPGEVHRLRGSKPRRSGPIARRASTGASRCRGWPPRLAQGEVRGVGPDSPSAGGDRPAGPAPDAATGVCRVMLAVGELP
jgi:hypothetical protein